MNVANLSLTYAQCHVVNATVSCKRAFVYRVMTAALVVVSAVNVHVWLRMRHAHLTSSVAQIFAETMGPAPGTGERLKQLDEGV
jgi:hypothetical protein